MKYTKNNRLFSTTFLLYLGLLGVSAAQTPEGTLEDRVNRYSQVYVPEKIYIHFDRPTYVVGETVWFTLSVVGEDLLPSPLSSIGYIDLIDSERQTVLEAKVKLTKGRGVGSLQLTTQLPTGNYLFRGYTNWLKNFSEKHFFETAITIINPFSLEEPTDDAHRAAAKSLKPDLQFFPEGGTALAGVENKIAFRAQGSDGKGISFSGRLLSQSGDVVATFQPTVHGIGHFLFRPQTGENYRAEIVDASGSTYSFPFTEVRETGFAIRLINREEQLEIAVRTPTESSEPLYLLVYNADKSTAYQADWSKGTPHFHLAKSRLKPGVNVLSVFDGALRPVAQRLYFHEADESPSLRIATEQEHYSPREKLSLKLRTRHLSDTVNASVSVFLTDSLPELPQPSINAWLLLSSELNGQVENPTYYFSADTPRRAEALDNLMLTHGWRRYTPEQLVGTIPTPSFLPEINGHFIRGKVVSSNGEKPLSNRPVFAAYPTEKILPWVDLSDSDGNFLFETRDFEGPKELVLQTNFRMDSTSHILLENPFHPVGEPITPLPQLTVTPALQADLLKRSINMQTQNSYFPQKPYNPPRDSVAFYGTPDFTYYLDDYTRFPTMEEILSEYVPAVSIRRRRGKYYTRVFETGVYKQVFTEDPLLMIDGIPVFDTDRIIQFDPLKIKKVDVVNRMYYLGPLVFPGIVSYSTYTHDLAGFEVDPRALIVAYEGTLRQRDFYHPRYDNKIKNDHRRPDFRNLLFWDPSVKIPPGEGASLDFYTSDQKGSYRIVVQGLSENGLPVSAISRLSVNDK